MPKKRTVKVTDLTPRFVPVRPRIFCEGVLTPLVTEQNRSWRERREKDPSFRASKVELRRKQYKLPDSQCAMHIKYEINGQFYCRKHAALVALDLVAVKAKV